VRFEHVRGHSGIPGNERVDTLAVEETQRIMAGSA
jgi:ribonuclease HI